MNRFVPDENFLARWTSGELSEAELAEWKASPDYVEYMRILDTSAALELPATREQADIWNELSAKLTEAPVVKMDAPVRKFVLPRWSYAAVAAVALLFALFVFIPDTSTYQTLAAQTETVTLPDGSTVHMHAGSTLSFSDDWDGNRTVNLAGEAFFEVKKGEKFTVITPRGNVEVLGTSFNVKARSKSFKTTCYTGKVRVSNILDASEQLLTPGLVAALDENGSLNKIELDLDGSSPEWMRGKYRFRNDPLSDIAPEFERIFDVNIDLEIDNDRISKKYNYTVLSNDLKTELENLSKVIGGTKIVYDAEKQIRILPTP